MEILLALIGMGIGALSGFFGIGGGTVLVPVLLLLGFGMKHAVGISIMQMVFSSLYGSWLNWRKGTLVLGEGIFVGLGGFAGGYISGYITPYVSNRFLQFVFVGFVLFALFRMMTSKVHEDEGLSKTLPKWLLFAIGTGIGIVAISIGVGGAIILIPLLSGLLHYPVKKAVSAGLFFVVFSSVAGLLGRLVPPFAIDDAWTASTLRGWILPALRNGLWNGPIIGGGRLGAAVAMGIVALIWLLALAGVLRLWSKDVGPGPRVGAAFLTAALLVMQARAGTVTPRQKGWFLRVAPAFVVSPRHRASERGNVATP